MEDHNPWSEVKAGSSWSTPIHIDDDPSPPPKYEQVASTGMEGKNQMLLLVFIHGFKGSADTTFEDFPSRLTQVLQETYPGLNVSSLIYPTYDTRGSLAAAVDAFVEWLTEQCVTIESKPTMDASGQTISNTGRGGGMASVKIILTGHSMGGLIAVDAALAISESSPEGKAWPRVCGVVAYDTPYYGVHPGVFKNGITKYAGYVQTAQTIGTFFAPMGVGLAAKWNAGRNEPADNKNKAVQSSSSWRTALMTTGAVALASGAAASAAYFNKDRISGAYGYLTDHLAFVSNLWDDKALRQRLDKLVAQPNILFHCYYTRLPTKPLERTFVILPPRDGKAASSFTPMDNDKAADEVDAHISMFNAKANPKYFDLGLRTANLIALCLDNESRYGNQVQAQASSSDAVEEEKGLRFGDAEIDQLEAEIKQQQQSAKHVQQ